jgi:bifunctional DNA-binding transcriptional regulator/antitoxin component of YhaV-PrlF toxin-antitoxin module
LKKLAKTKITNSSLTTVPKAVKMFLNIKNGDSLEWCVNKDNEIILKKGRSEKP